MIADRRKDQQKNIRKGAKKPSTTDRSIATGRAKRDAAMKGRRGLSEQTKPSAMEVDREIYRQSRKTAVAKKISEKKASGGRLPPNSSFRDTKTKHNGTAAKKMTPQHPTGAAASVVGGKTPSKKQVEAAIIAMTDIGQPVPAGHQLVLTFVPMAATAIPQMKPHRNGKRGGGSGGAAGAGGGTGTGAGGGPKTQNNSNFRRGRGYKN